jgi:hypothetical protein
VCGIGEVMIVVDSIVDSSGQCGLVCPMWIMIIIVWTVVVAQPYLDNDSGDLGYCEGLDDEALWLTVCVIGNDRP